MICCTFRETRSSSYRSSPARPHRLLARGASLGPANGPHLAATSASAEEVIAAIGLEPRNAHSGRHLEALHDLSRSRIDSPQIALVTVPGAVPELSVDPGNPGDEAVGLDRAKNRPCLGTVSYTHLTLPTKRIV